MKNSLKDLLAEGKTAQVLAALQQSAALDADDQNLVRLLAARYAENERQQHAGTLAHETYRVERNSINAAVLAVLEKLPEEAPRASAVEEQAVSRDNKWKKMGGSIIIAVGLLAGIAELSGFSLRDFFEKKEVKEEVAPPLQAPIEKDTPAVKETTQPHTKTPAAPQQATPRNHFESKDQSKQINIPDNQGTIHINQ